jgi:hypothetical protein
VFLRGPVPASRLQCRYWQVQVCCRQVRLKQRSKMRGHKLTRSTHRSTCNTKSSSRYECEAWPRGVFMYFLVRSRFSQWMNAMRQRYSRRPISVALEFSPGMSCANVVVNTTRVRNFPLSNIQRSRPHLLFGCFSHFFFAQPAITQKFLLHSGRSKRTICVEFVPVLHSGPRSVQTTSHYIEWRSRQHCMGVWVTPFPCCGDEYSSPLALAAW